MSLTLDIAVRRRALEVAAALEVDRGERLALFGPSGAGKSTVLESICGLIRGVRGRIELDGAPLGTMEAARHAQISFVRQPTLLFPHLTVEENILYGLSKEDTRRSKRSVPALLEPMALEGLAKARPLALSGGQRQRVALARAIHRPFRLLLLDEPFSAIDGPTRTLLRQLTETTVEERQASALLVSHDLAEAQAFGQRLAVMYEGRIAQIGLPGDVVRAPLDEEVAALCGYTCFLDEAPGLEIPTGRSAAIHPDRVQFGASPAEGVVLSGRVRGWRPKGPRIELDVSPLDARLRPVSARERSQTSTQDEQEVTYDSRTSAPAPAYLQVMVDTALDPGTDISVTVVSPPLVSSVARRGRQEGSSSARISTAV